MTQYILISPQELTDLISAAVKKELEPFTDMLTGINNSNEKEEYLTRHEAADFLHCSLTTLYYYEQQNILKPLRIRRKILYPKSDLIASMKDKENNSGIL